MIDPGWVLCVLQIDDEVKLQAAYRQIYVIEYVRADVRDWAGRRVRFHGPSFGHAFSEASNYRLSAGIHDVPLSLARLQRIRWIKLALAGEGVRIDVLAQTRQDSRGRMKRRRSLIVPSSPETEERYDLPEVTAPVKAANPASPPAAK